MPSLVRVTELGIGVATLCALANVWSVHPGGDVNDALSRAARGRRAVDASRLKPLPLRFEPPALDAMAGADTIARGRGYSLSLSNGKATLSLQDPSAAKQRSVRLTLAGEDVSPSPSYEAPLAGISNYLIGTDQSRWRRNVPGYGKVRYAGVYPGIDLVFYGNEGQLEYDFIVAPGADPSRIELRFEGADSVSLDDGELVLALGSGEVRQRRPVLYQTSHDGVRREVNGRYALRGSTVRFQVDEYDASVPLVIDPVLTYATYLGGQLSEFPADVRVDSEGSMYVFGSTTANDYPVTPPRVRTEQPLYRDVVISKLSADGSQLIYSTYFGGTAHDDDVGSMTIDAAGNVYMVVSSSASDFPVMAGGYGVDTCSAGCPGDGIWVVKLNATGTGLIYTAHISGVDARVSTATGSTLTFPGGLALDAQGRAIVAIRSFLPVPIVNAAQPTRGDMGTDAYIFKLNETGTGLVFATHLGGNGLDSATAVDTDGVGNIYVVGTTRAADFPRVNAIQTALSGVSDGFVAVYSPEGQLLRSTYFGGNEDDGVQDIAVLPDGSAVITGFTNSTNFPVRNAFQTTFGGSRNWDVFVTRFEASFDLRFSTYLGAANSEFGSNVAFDVQGNVHLLAMARAAGLPLALPAQTYRGADDLYYAKFGQTGQLTHATYLGGSSFDQPIGIDADASGRAFILARIFSTDAPVVNALQPSPGRFGTDMYIVRLATVAEIHSVNPAAVPPGAISQVRISGANLAAGMRVFVSGRPAHAVIVESSTSMIAVVPSLPEGVYDVAAVSPFGEFAVLRDGLLYGRCRFELATSMRKVLGSGGSLSVQVQASAPLCGWTAQSNVPWITVETPQGIGSTPARFTVAPNLTRIARTGIVSIAGLTLTVDQVPSALVDFNGDAQMDLIWQHQGDGRVAYWLMRGTNTMRGEEITLPVVFNNDAAWKIAGAGDLSGDGVPDLVWQNSSQEIHYPLWISFNMWTGATLFDVTTTSAFAPVPVWRIRSVGDWDGDGLADLVWHHQGDGRVAVWFMRIDRQVSGTLLSAPAVSDPGWQIAGSGDFNRDGHRDLLWQHDDGRLAVWLMNGTALMSGEPLVPSAVADRDWKVRAVGDINGDGHVDLIWQHRTRGRLSAWLMNGLRMVAGPDLSPNAVDPMWQIVGPR